MAKEKIFTSIALDHILMVSYNGKENEGWTVEFVNGKKIQVTGEGYKLLDYGLSSNEDRVAFLPKDYLL